MKRFRITRRLLLAFLLVSPLPLLLLGTALLETFEEGLRRNAARSLAAVADRKADQIDAFLRERVVDARLLSQASEVQRALLEAVWAFEAEGPESLLYREVDHGLHDYFAYYLDTGGYTDLLLISARGDVVFSAAREEEFGTNLIHGPYRDTGLARVVLQAQSLLETTLSDFARFTPFDEPAAFLAAPVIRNGEVLGSVALQIDKRRIYAVIGDELGLGRSGETLVARADGEEALVMAPLRYDPEAAMQRRLPLAAPEAEAVRRALAGERGQAPGRDYRGREVLAAWRYLPRMRWGMVVKMDTEEAYAAVRRLRRVGFGVMALLIAAAVLAALYLGRGIVRPVRALTRATGAIAAGDLERRATLEGGDELGELAVSFNLMADRLQTAHETLERRVEARTAELRAEVAERRRAEERLRLTAAVFENTSEAVVITDPQARIVEVNDAYCEITGYGRDELIGRNPNVNRSGRHDAAFFRAMWAALARDGAWSGEIWDRRKNGEVFPKWLSINAVEDGQGRLTHYVGVFSDITAIKQAEEKLERLAYYDSLTGLPNRLLFRDRLEHELAAAHRRGGAVALMFIDLDRFKYVNDTLGHSAGDELLTTIATRLRGCVRESDTVARLGGDEFTVILTELRSPEGAEGAAGVARELIERVSEPLELQGQEVFVGASIGISLYPDDGTTLETLTRNADTAMYHAKEAGRGTYRFFTEVMNERTREHLTLEAGLRHALERGELELHYQPQALLDDGSLIGAEALLRWRHPERGLVPPLEFIPLAEETGLILPIGEWVVREVCRQLREWRERGLDGLRVAVNLSPRQFRQEGLAEGITAILEEYQIEPEALELEITESALMEDTAAAAGVLAELQARGLRVAVDDFGTGYSSLAYLKTFPLDKLKIDRSFIVDIPRDANDVAITEAVIRMAASLGLKVVAEGVEEEGQREFLTRHGCDYLQGFLYGRPLPAAEFEAFARRGRASPGD